MTCLPFREAYDHLAAQQVADKINATGGKCTLIPFDVADSAAVTAVLEPLLEIEVPFVLVNNAGFARDGIMALMSQNDWEDVLAVHLNGFFNVSRLVVARMLKKRCGRIVNIVSTSDDIDAFGMIGVFRYIEIYAIRGVDKNILPNMVLENLSNRFQNLKYTFSYLCKVVEEQEVRYKKARSFFSRVQKAMLESNENDPAIQAYDFIYDGFISHNFSFEQMYMKALSIESSIGFKSYFYDFKNEMDLHK